MKIYLPHKKDFILELTNNNYSIETIKNYNRDLEIFEKFLFLNKTPYSKVTKKTLTLYKGFLSSGKFVDLEANNPENDLSTIDNQESSSKASKTDGKIRGVLSSRSINRMLSTLRSYFRFMVDFDYKIPVAPDAIKLIKTERKESQVADFDELVKLIEYPEEFEKNKFVKYRNRAILELFFSTGLRISELVNLKKEQLNISDEGHVKQSKIFVLGKGKKQRFVYLTERCRFYLDRYLSIRKDNYPAVFIPRKGVRAGTKNPSVVKISPRYIQMKIKEYRRLLGIIVPTSPHSLRHGFATYLAEKGASPVAIQRLLGHESLQTTTRYVHASDKFAEKEHNEFHPLRDKK